MISLNPEQQAAVAYSGNIVVTACPGSGKTRVLTARVLRAVGELQSRQERVVALTYTNRAADEIQLRLDQEDVDLNCLWAGTIHAFALEWILRPYAPYNTKTQLGFSVANEFVTNEILRELKEAAGLDEYAEMETGFTRSGDNLNTDPELRAIFAAYKERLVDAKLLDFDDVLYLAYSLLDEYPEIAANLGSILRVICVDEVQDIQDLQYGIITKIVQASAKPVCLFLVGDEDQSIYESLGATTKTPQEIAAEFSLDAIEHQKLNGNYRSTQRIVDFYRVFRPDVPPLEARASYAAQRGILTFENQTISKDNLAASIAARITAAIRDGVPTSEICVVAPHWWHVRSLARRLVHELPEIEFDAPGLSPLHSSRENFWFRIGRLVLTRPSQKRTRTRMRWAKEALGDLCEIADIAVPENISTPRRLLRLLNSLVSEEVEGLAYLHDVFGQFLKHIKLDVATCVALKDAYDGFFQKAENHLLTSHEGLAN